MTNNILSEVLGRTQIGDNVRSDILWGGLYDIYHKNDESQKKMRDLAFKTNTNPNGIDHYYHRKTAYEAAQHSVPIGVAMLMAGNMKEYRDIIRDTYKHGFAKAFKESKKDLKNNAIGFILGSHSDLPAEQNPQFNSYNSKTVNFLLPQILEDAP